MILEMGRLLLMSSESMVGSVLKVGDRKRGNRWCKKSWDGGIVEGFVNL